MVRKTGRRANTLEGLRVECVNDAEGHWRSPHHYDEKRKRIVVRINYKMVDLARAFYEAEIGPLTPRDRLYKLCIVKNCVNPHEPHFVKTTAAMITRDTSTRRKLTHPQVMEILALLELNQVSAGQIAYMYDVSPWVIRSIRDGKSYRQWTGRLPIDPIERRVALETQTRARVNDVAHKHGIPQTQLQKLFDKVTRDRERLRQQGGRLKQQNRERQRDIDRIMERRDDAGDASDPVGPDIATSGP